MNDKYKFTKAEIEAKFMLLKDALMETDLEFTDFMLMHETTEGTIGFKHYDSRNYVFLIPNGNGGYKLYIPTEAKPSMKGEFGTGLNMDKESFEEKYCNINFYINRAEAIAKELRKLRDNNFGDMGYIRKKIEVLNELMEVR